MRLLIFSLFFPANIIAATQLICRLSSLGCKALLLYGTDHPADRSLLQGAGYPP